MSASWTEQVTPLQQHHATLVAVRDAGKDWKRMSTFARACCVQEAAVRLGYYTPPAAATTARWRELQPHAAAVRKWLDTGLDGTPPFGALRQLLQAVEAAGRS